MEHDEAPPRAVSVLAVTAAAAVSYTSLAINGATAQTTESPPATVGSLDALDSRHATPHTGNSADQS
jgi:hypothetical protein